VTCRAVAESAALAHPVPALPNQVVSSLCCIYPTSTVVLFIAVHNIMATNSSPNEPDGTLTLSSFGREPCPEGSVPLHELCDNCKRFSANWELLHLFTDSKSMTAHSESVKNEYTLCMIEELVRSRATCHLCTMVLYQLITSSEEDLISHLKEPLTLSTTFVNYTQQHLKRIYVSAKHFPSFKLDVELYDGELDFFNLKQYQLTYQRLTMVFSTSQRQ
jgi:hypothetical protein